MLAMQVNHSSTFPSSTPDRLLPSVSVLRRPPFSIPRLSFAVFILLLLLLFLSLSPTSLSFSSLSPSAKQRHTRLLSPSHTIRISLFVPLSFPQHFQRDFAFIRESLSFFLLPFFFRSNLSKSRAAIVNHAAILKLIQIGKWSAMVFPLRSRAEEEARSRMARGLRVSLTKGSLILGMWNGMRAFISKKSVH